ncbi:putative FAD linked oxidase domain protein [Streptomyces viridochromogenes Tue57]|uniref:Putative FAD linked oxidase domain protein n=1 Tax=Streptomyces viridochromogenes Tue57 TaxID=1160705 RepID=L8PNY1_STRVR|nr:putative FAD linked oxidase domain protein [Streptomyces viridochromogenes Tue57]
MGAEPRRRKFWGWGYEDEQPPPSEVRRIAARARGLLGFGGDHIDEPARIADLELRRARPLAPPARLAALCRDDPYERAVHAMGKSYKDVVRGFRGEMAHPPDLVAFPRDDDEIAQLLEWCARTGVAVVPYGGGTSVVGGVEPRVDDAYRGTLSLDLRNISGVVDMDRVSQAVRIRAGTLLPEAEALLKPFGMSLRHYPQSYTFATVGGCLATRAAGHYATGPTRIDDRVESLRTVTPEGVWESRRLPASGAGPSPDRLLLGSEGTLGVITEAWLRVQSRPVYRASTAVEFTTFAEGARAARAIVRLGLRPAQCRLLDEGEAELTGAGDGSCAVLLLGFESAHLPQESDLERAVRCCLDFAGRPTGRPRIRGPHLTVPQPTPPNEPEALWRDGFLAAPYLRDALVAAGILVETFETAITWDRFAEFETEVGRATRKAAIDVCGAAVVHRRLTHVYPDGAAVYFTVLAPARPGSESAQWDAVKAAACDIVLRAGGTVTHHHAVGRDHRPWYDRQRPDLFAAALHAAKRAVDPHAVLNPGVLIDAHPAGAAPGHTPSGAA